MDWKGRVAVVTGANSGIGFKIVERFLGMDMVVVGLDRNIENIKGKSAKLHALRVDLTKEEEVSRAFQWIEENTSGADVLVNNAGLGGTSPLIEGKMTEWRPLFNTNVLALAQCIAEAIRSMRKRDITHGQIINITSLQAHYVPSYGPFHAYSATKHAAKALIEGFRLELKEIQSPIRISCVAPGLVKTEIMRTAFGEEMHNTMYGKFTSLDPDDVASVVEYILSVPQHVEVNDIQFRHSRQQSVNLK